MKKTITALCIFFSPLLLHAQINSTNDSIKKRDFENPKFNFKPLIVPKELMT